MMGKFTFRNYNKAHRERLGNQDGLNERDHCIYYLPHNKHEDDDINQWDIQKMHGAAQIDELFVRDF